VKSNPFETFATVVLTAFLFTIVPQGIWSALFGQLEWIGLERFELRFSRASSALTGVSVSLGALMSMLFYVINLLVLNKISEVYQMTGNINSSSTSRPLLGALGYAIGGATMGFVVARTWRRAPMVRESP
jgi:hypothetical protein